MTTIRTLTLAILATLAPLAARAAESPACDRSALARAEAAAVTAQRKAFESLDPAEGRVAAELVAAAVEQVRTARALCDVAAPSQSDPFDAAPAQDAIDPDQAELCSVLGNC